MSKESYARGFCKAAMANGVDPDALASLMFQTSGATEKKAADYGAFGVDWENLKKSFLDAKAKYYDNQDDATKMLITGGGAALGGALLSKLLGGSGLGGAVLGGIAGVAPHVDWKAISDSLSKKPGRKGDEPAQTAAPATTSAAQA